MNRDPLAQWSASLTDDEFPMALAALGVLAGLAQNETDQLYDPTGWRLDVLPERFKSALESAAGLLYWDMLTPLSSTAGESQIQPTLSNQRASIAFPPAEVLVAVWRDFLKRIADPTAARSGLRLVVPTTGKALLQAAHFASLLAYPQVGAASVYLTPERFFAPMAHTDWRWPFTVATLPDDPLAEPFTQIQQQIPQASPFRLVVTSAQARQAEIFVSSAGAADTVKRLEALEWGISSRLLIVTGLGTTPLAEQMPPLEILAARMAAAGIAMLAPGESTPRFAERLRGLCDRLLTQQSLDSAFAEVFRPTEALLILHRDLPLLKKVEDSGFIRVAKRPSTTVVPATFATAARSILDPDSVAISTQPSTAVTNVPLTAERYIQQQSYRQQNGQFVRERSCYIVGQPTLVTVFIAPQQEDSTAADEVFPDNELPADADKHRLRVVFEETKQFDDPMVADLVLPRHGSSTYATFTFIPRKEGVFKGTISIVHHNRLLQVCLLRTRVFQDPNSPAAASSSITLEVIPITSASWSDLEKKTNFDAALLLGRSQEREPTMTGVAGQQIWTYYLAKKIDDFTSDINRLISDVAHWAKDKAAYERGLDQGENPELLRDLARMGRSFYKELQERLLLPSQSQTTDPSPVPHLQVVSIDPDLVVPLEFVYEFDAPSEQAAVCPDHLEALKAGRCPKNCPRSSAPSQYVCPMGFWGLNKVIERHLYNPGQHPRLHASLSFLAEPIKDRKRLSLRSGAVLAYSQEIQNNRTGVKAVSHLEEILMPNLSVVKDWVEWKQCIQNKHPTLLVAFPHNVAGSKSISLEIGGKKLDTLELESAYVRAENTSSPLVFLLGCDVAGTESVNLANHIHSFRRAGAAVIVSTIATVFGTHAVQVGEAIIARLLEYNGSESMTIGDAIREAKCAALRQSLPMALCVVAFGDADWRL
ncbi:MAG: hypothetical protein IPK64_22230 [bacterium]|nr:hypothetical protein [bacterium]